MWIKENVEYLINKHSTNNPFQIAEAERIYVCHHNLHEEIMGFYKYIRRNQFIFINSNLDSKDQQFTCAHELGHSKLHPRINTPFLRNSTLFSINKIEQEANRFAVELLMPDTAIASLPYTNLTGEEAAKIFGIPKEICQLKKMSFI